MTIRRSKKVRKQRGSRTHGYGRISGGHRKGGQRGGKGNAGIKDHKRITRIKALIDSQKGFTAPNPNLSTRAINIGDINRQIEKLVANGMATKEGKGFKINLTEHGITKVMGKGLVTNTLQITVENITTKAKEKIETAGGKVILVSEVS